MWKQPAGPGQPARGPREQGQGGCQADPPVGARSDPPGSARSDLPVLNAGVDHRCNSHTSPYNLSFHTATGHGQLPPAEHTSFRSWAAARPASHTVAGRWQSLRPAFLLACALVLLSSPPPLQHASFLLLSRDPMASAMGAPPTNERTGAALSCSTFSRLSAPPLSRRCGDVRFLPLGFPTAHAATALCQHARTHAQPRPHASRPPAPSPAFPHISTLVFSQLHCPSQAPHSTKLRKCQAACSRRQQRVTLALDLSAPAQGLLSAQRTGESPGRAGVVNALARR